MQSTKNATTRPGRKSKGGRNHFNPRAPLRDLRECARIMGITYNQAQYLERIALIKIRPALVAWGYRDEIAQGM
jgi:hypothetical protein